MSVLKSIKQNSSFLILGFGAISLFLSNFLAKIYLSEVDFIYWVYFISISNILFSFSLFGQEQLILRFCKNIKGNIYLDYNVIVINLVSMLVFSCLAYKYQGYFFEHDYGYSILVLSILASFIQVFYQIYRSQKFFLLSQAIYNLWKIMLLLFLFFIIMWGGSVEFVFYLSLVVSVVFAFVFLYQHRNKLFFIKGSNKIEYTLCFSFFIALGSVTFVNYIERFLVEGEITSYEYSQYIYALTIVVSPFNIIASYLGFKEAVKYKESFSLSNLNKDIVKMFFIIVPVLLLWYFSLVFFKDLLNIEVDNSILYGLVFICFFRTIYSLFSSCMSVVLSGKNILILNLIFIVFCCLTYSFTINVDLTIQMSLWLINILWLLRCSLIYFFVVRQYVQS